MAAQLGIEAARNCVGRCGLTNAQRPVWCRVAGVEGMVSFTRMKTKDLRTTSHTLLRMPNGFPVPALTTRNIEALIEWTRLRMMTGQDLFANAFTAAVLTDMLDKMEARDAAEALGHDGVDGPGRFYPNNWISWSCGFLNMLDSRRASNKSF